MQPGNPSSPPNAPQEEPISQERKGFRHNWPIWMQQLPILRGPKPVENFQLVDMARLEELLKDADPAALQRIKDDIQYMDHELLRLFKQCDYQASLNQNSYRMFQLGYIVLAALAALIGSLQALSLNTTSGLLPWFGFAEAAVALIAVYMSTLISREPPLPRWMDNRRKAETLRREYFRYLMNLAPYDQVDGPDRRRMLSRRAADINRGVYPDFSQ
jgi:hypothetical protein